MGRPLFAVCPRCGNRADLTKIIRDREEEESIALIRCTCGRSQMVFTESRILHIDLDNPYMRENHFDLLLPPGWTKDMWNRISAGLSSW